MMVMILVSDKGLTITTTQCSVNIPDPWYEKLNKFSKTEVDLVSSRAPLSKL